MHFIYIDDSRSPSGLCVFSALAIPAEQWKTAFASIRKYRRELRTEYGIYMRKEFHATEFVSGRGKIADGAVFKGTRCKIFLETLERIAQLPHAKLFNAAMTRNKELLAFERLLNRINRTMLEKQSRALLLCDEGKESIYTRLARKMGVHNPIPSMYGVWPEGHATRNIPLDRIIEDPFLRSHTIPTSSNSRTSAHTRFFVEKNQFPRRRSMGCILDLINSARSLHENAIGEIQKESSERKRSRRPPEPIET